MLVQEKRLGCEQCRRGLDDWFDYESCPECGEKSTREVEIHKWSPSMIHGAMLDRLVKEKKVRRKWHPDWPHLAVYKYAAGYDFFDPADSDTCVVELCRGLVYDHLADCIVARGIPKFYNHFRYPQEELEKLFLLDYDVQEKVDGSCVLLWHYQGEWHFSTLGGFRSKQAGKAKAIFNKRYSALTGQNTVRPGRTYVFEVIYPENRIVLENGYDERLVYLCEFENLTGEEHCTFEFGWMGDGGTPRPVFGKYSKHISLEELRHSVDEYVGVEGCVVRFYPGDDKPPIRVKFKTKWYFEQTAFLSRIRIQGLVKTLSEYYKAGREVPDNRETDGYVKEIHRSVDTMILAVQQFARELINYHSDRRGQADAVLALPIPSDLKSAIFAALDGTDDNTRFLVWKTLEGEQPSEVSGVVVEYKGILSAPPSWEGTWETA